MKVKAYIFGILLCIGGAVVPLEAQMAGGPIGSRGEREWTVSAFVNYMHQGIGHEGVTSRRGFVKSNWGLNPWFDAYVLLGGVQVEMHSYDPHVVDYKSEYAFGAGIGFTITVPFSRMEQGAAFWLGGYAMRFPSKGSFMAVSELITREHAMEYDWREFQGQAGLIISYGSVRMYAAGVGWAVQRLETKKEYIVYEDSQEYIGEVEAEYRSALWTGGLIGLELLFRGGHSISIEFLGFNEENYQIMAAISQTGILKW